MYYDAADLSFLTFLLLTQKPAREHDNPVIQVYGDAARISFMVLLLRPVFGSTGGD